MPEILNLRLARKSRDRRLKQAEAEQNRVLFGRAKDARRFADAERAKAERDLDGRRLSAPDPAALDPAPIDSAPIDLQPPRQDQPDDP